MRHTGMMPVGAVTTIRCDGEGESEEGERKERE